MLARCFFVTFLLGCGRLDASADAATDSPSDTSAICSGKFTQVIPLDGLNTPDDERGLRFTLDERLGVFTRRQSPETSDAPAVFTVQRATATSQLLGPSLAFAANGHQQYPSLVNGGAQLYFEEQCYGTVGFSFLCYVNGDGGLFALNSSGPGETPSLAGPELNDYFHGFVSADAGSYYFVGRVEADGGFTSWEYGDRYDGDASLAQALFATHQSQPGRLDTFGPQPVAVTSASSPLVLDNPVVSANELTLFVSVTSDAQPIPHIYVAQRGSTTDVFDHVVSVTELDSAEGEYPTWVSPDGCRLYFTRMVAGQTDLFVASR